MTLEDLVSSSTLTLKKPVLTLPAEGGGRGDDALMCCESAKSAQLVLFSLILLMKSLANCIIFFPHQAERKKKVLTFKIPADLYVRPFSL